MTGDHDLPGSPYAKRYGYPDTFRLRVVAEALQSGDFVATARTFNVALSSLYRWARKYKPQPGIGSGNNGRPY